MTEAPDTLPMERRLLVLAPVGRDAQLMQEMLQREGVACTPCADQAALLAELGRGAGAILLTEEALEPGDSRLADSVEQQPPWSDLPVLVVTRPGADSPIAGRAVSTLGNVTLLERPVRVAALSSAVRSALRARDRQYHTRAHLREREEADRRKDEFLATLAHELRNPLAPIVNAVSLLRLSMPSQPEIWGLIDRQARHMVRLVDDLLEVSRITRGTIELRKSVVDLGSVVKSAVETCRPLIETARHEVTVSLPGTPLEVEGDAVRLAQVFTNLINNAARYTDPGGCITVEVRGDDRGATVTVSDTGIGIHPDELPRVFEMFVQVNAHDHRSQSGLGIGLTLARRIIEMHGGSISADSAGLGCGTQFTVRLPAAAADARRVSSSGAPDTEPVRSLQRVLVVDDNHDAADSLGAVLELLGAEVRVAYDGEAALRAIETFHPHAAFLDIGMPGMDGYTVARCIRERDDASDIVLVALTGWGQDRDRRATQAAGFQHHLVKPADIGALRNLLESLD